MMISRTTRHTRHAARSRGFSLTELLTAISIAILLLGLTFPAVQVITSSGKLEAGKDTVGMAADVARQWVSVPPIKWAEDTTDAVSGEEYSGTAALYCPTGKIRIIFNSRNASASSGTPTYLEERSPEVNGYIDHYGVDFIDMPDNIGMAGIERTGSGATSVRFIAPPFAVAFNEFGQLHLGDAAGGRIYYDSNRNGTYNLSDTRGSSYNPSDWDGGSGATNANVVSNTNAVRALPFEAIECVPGIVVFNQDDFEEAGHTFDGGGAVTLGSTAGQWLQENGITMFFSPHTGQALIDEAE